MARPGAVLSLEVPLYACCIISGLHTRVLQKRLYYCHQYNNIITLCAVSGTTTSRYYTDWTVAELEDVVSQPTAQTPPHGAREYSAVRPSRAPRERGPGI